MKESRMKSSLWTRTAPVIFLALALCGCRDCRDSRGLGVQIKGEGCEVIRVPDYWLPPVRVQHRLDTRDPIWMARRGLQGVAWRAKAADVKLVDELLIAAQFETSFEFGPPLAEAPQEFVYSTNKYAFRLRRDGARRLIEPAPYRTVSDEEWNAAAPIACNSCEPYDAYPASSTAFSNPAHCKQGNLPFAVAGEHFLYCTPTRDDRWLRVISYDGPRQPTGFMAMDFSLLPRTVHLEYYDAREDPPKRISHSTYRPGSAPVWAGRGDTIQYEFFITWAPDFVQREALVCSMPIWKEDSDDRK